jgi:hypothetical protein
MAGAAYAQAPAKVAGKWEMTTQGRQGPVTSTLTLEQDGEKLKGTLSGQRGDAPVTGTIKGNDINFSVTRQTPNGEFTIEYTGKVDGETMKGTISGGPGGGGPGGGQAPVREWSAKKAK